SAKYSHNRVWTIPASVKVNVAPRFRLRQNAFRKYIERHSVNALVKAMMPTVIRFGITLLPLRLLVLRSLR
ncbi:MAG: hypothetical protein ABI064_03770, partial [Acidobacteriaceae bacterium]